MNRSLLFAWPLVVTLAFLGCTGPSDTSNHDDDKDGSDANTSNVEFPEGDPDVSAEDGGAGFTGEGWETAESEPIGDPRAVKGGAMLSHILTWPDNLRMYGTKANTQFNYLVRDMMYESLLSLDPRNLNFRQGLASHWKISDDKMTFTFRINPKAHWSDGKPVVADDVIATYRLINDDTLVDPMSKASICEKMEEPVAKSKYIVEVKCKSKDWRNFITMAGMILLPAHEVGDLTGEQYLKQYNFKYTAVTGPYIVNDEDIKTDESITITRRKDYWAKDDPGNVGLFNIDKIRFLVIRDNRLAFEKALKGELDFYAVYTAKWWVEDLGENDALKKGHLIRQKVYTKYPKGFQGPAFNMRRPPLDDVRIRKAIAHLYDRKTMIKKFAYDEYLPLKSYYPSSDAENHDNELIEYDPQTAAKLLDEAGWKERGADGIRLKDGKRLSITMIYRSQFFEKYLTVLKEACEQAGVEINLQLMDPQAAWANMQDRKFEMISAAWGAILFPNPRTNYFSTLSDEKGSNNIPGYESEEIDNIIVEYEKEFDYEKRVELLRSLDAELYKIHGYMLDWYSPSERIMYWNRFGTPETVLLKFHEWDDAFALWWIDPEKDKALKAAKKSGENLEAPEEEIKPW